MGHYGIIIKTKAESLEEAKAFAESFLTDAYWTSDYWYAEFLKENPDAEEIEDDREYDALREEFYEEVDATDMWDYAYGIVETWGDGKGNEIKGVMTANEMREWVKTHNIDDFFTLGGDVDEYDIETPDYALRTLDKDGDDIFFIVGEYHL